MKQLILILALAVSTGLQAQDQTIKKSYDGIKKIELNTAAGDCLIEKHNKSNVELELKHSYDTDVFEPVFEQKGDVLVLKEKFERNSTSRGSSQWKLKVPEHIDISFNTGSGDLHAKNLSIEIKSNSGSGDVAINNITGDVDVNTGSGDIGVTMYSGTLNVNAGSGDVDFNESKGDFTVNLGSGDINAMKIHGEISMNVGSGDIKVKDVVLTASSSFNTGSGSAEIALVSPLTHDISINSGSGDAVLNFMGVKMSGAFTMKANKRNGEISAPFEFDKVTEEERGSQTIVKKEAQVGDSTVKINISTGSGHARVER